MASPIVLFGDEHVVAQPAKLKTQQKFWSWLKNTGRGFEIHLDGDDSPLFTVETKHIGQLRTLKDKQGRTICTLNHSFFSSEDCWTAVRDNKTLLSVKYSWTPKECTIILEGLSDGKGVAPTLKVHRSSKWLGSFSIQREDGQEVAKSRCINMAQSATSMLKVTPPTWEMDVPAGTDLVLVRHLAPHLNAASSRFTTDFHTGSTDLRHPVRPLLGTPLVHGLAYKVQVLRRLSANVTMANEHFVHSMDSEHLWIVAAFCHRA
jgi:hypothetical protein